MIKNQDQDQDQDQDAFSKVPFRVKELIDAALIKKLSAIKPTIS